jgi:molecular chaperone Hsp33
LSPNTYPPAVASMLAEAMAMGAVLASGLKYDGIFTLQLQGDGPVGLIVVDITSEGHMRGCARFDAERLDAGRHGPEGPVPRLLGAGHMAFTVDQGPDTDRYQGITLLEGATLSDCAHTYFRQSEQLITAIRLCSSNMAEAGSPPRAAALMLQRLPASGLAEDQADEDWRRAVVMMSSATTAELLTPELSSEQLLYRLFHEDGVRVFRPRRLRHQCRCSRDRVFRLLGQFPPEDLAMMAEDGRITVTCEFCKSGYVFDAGDWGLPDRTVV